VVHHGRSIVPRQKAIINKNKYFNKDGWEAWKRHVSNFYRHNQSQVSPLFIPKGADNRPYISVKLFDQDIVVLFDSGATSSIVGSEGLNILKQFNLKTNFSSHKTICTADGRPQTVKGVIDLPLSVSFTCHVIKALVVPSLPHSFIMGVDFAKQFKILVNFKNNSWHVQSDYSNLDLVVEQPKTSFVSDFLYSLDELSPQDRLKADKVIDSFKSISSKDKLGCTNKLSLKIETGDAKPFRKRPYPMSPYMSEILNREVDEMLKLGVIEPSNSPWCSPVLLVKKPTGEYRFCFDGRSLNEVTEPDPYPMPDINRILCMLRGAKYISSIDLRKAFWQVPLDPESRPKTAFSIIGKGLFQFRVMPFGLCNAAQTQQRLVDSIFGPKYEPHLFSYIDDLLLLSSTFEEHLSLLEEVKSKLQDANLTINLDKCEFFKSSLKFLGFIVGSNSLRTDPEKVSCMINYPRPRTATEVKRFVGLCSWYRRFIKDFASLMSPINDLIKGRKKSQSITWNDQAEEAFIKVKQLLVSAPILSQPDFTKKFVIQCDASNTGLGGVLTQEIDGEERVIAYASRGLSKSERNYSTTELECLAVIFAISKFRCYIEGVRFTVISDHYSLLWLNSMKNPTGKLARWAVKLREHNFELLHRKGTFNVVPDALSRIPYDNEVPDVSEVALFKLDADRIDPWFDKMRENIRKNSEKFPQWKVENDFVYKFVPSKIPVPSNLPEWKFLVPKPQRSDVMKSSHEPPTSGHFGFYKTLARIQEYYYWPKMRQDILKFCRSCKICGAQKHPNTSPMGLMGKEKCAKFPFEIIAIDLIGPLPRSKKGNKWMLVVGDWFSKYTLIFPLKNAKAPIVNKILEESVFLIYGVPRYIIMDNGSQFVSNLLKKTFESYEIQQVRYTALYSPECNFVERNNKTVGTTLRCYIEENHGSWDQNLVKIQAAINTSKHEVHGYVPAFLVFGRHIPLSGQLYANDAFDGDSNFIPGNRDSYVTNIKGMKDVFEDVQRKLHNAYVRYSKSYNLRRRDVSFRVGDRVWRRNKVLSNAATNFSAKLAPKYILSVVKKKPSKLVYDLCNEDGSKAGRWHIKDLKAFYEYQDGDDQSSISSVGHEDE